MAFRLRLLPDRYAICRLPADAPLPNLAGEFVSATRTADELSIVCRMADIPAEARHEDGWRCLGVKGPLDFALVGVLASLAEPLAQSGVSVFVVSTFDTDYLLVRENDLASQIGRRETATPLAQLFQSFLPVRILFSSLSCSGVRTFS